MTKQEIEKAANESAHSFGSMEPCIAKIKQDVATRAYMLGATMVNEKQPYTAEDMEAFAEWTAFMQWIYDHTDKCWFQKHSSETITTAQLREMWENERRAK